MKSMNVKFRLTIWFVLIFLVIMLGIASIQFWLTLSGLNGNMDEELNRGIQTLDNLIVESHYDPFDIAHIGHSDMFKITDDEKTLLTSELWERNKLDSIPDAGANKIFKIRNKYFGLKKEDASKDALLATYQGYDFFQDTIEKGDTILLKELKRLRSIRLPNEFISPKGKIYLFVAKDVTIFQEVKIDYLNNFFKILPFIIVLLIIAGYFTTGRFLSPLGKMAEKAQEISAENLTERLPVNNPDDEFGKLAIVFNDAISRLHDSIDKLRQFTANVSHELRTPLTAIRSVGEVALKEENDIHKYREAIESMLEETDRLKCLIDKLLLLSRADAGKITIIPERFAINEFVQDTIETLKVLAEEKNIAMNFASNAEFEVFAEKATIRQALINVLDNAIRYTPSNSFITITTNLKGENSISIDIVDQGPGISLQDRVKVFDRFYRTDSARSRETGGNGLGLAIAKWAVEINKGTIEFLGEEAGGGHCRIILPLYKNS